jgi:hypothetical protein
MLARTLPSFLILGVLALAGAAQAFDRTCAQKQDAQGRPAERCLASVTIPETVVYGTLSDHGSAVGERYDAEGNPVDRQGNVVAVPAGRSGSSREVFAQEPAPRR